MAGAGRRLPGVVGRVRPWGAPGVAALVAVTVSCAVGAVRGRYPFGALSRSDRDLGQQFVPMLAHARDVLTGHADGGLVFSWHSGFGSPFLADVLAYVGTTTSWIALLLPRSLLDLALFLGLLVDVAAAAAAMTLLLRHLRPAAPAWLGVAGGVAYAAGAWPMELGYMATWVTGLVALPAFALVLDRLRTRPTPARAATAVAVVAVLWSGQFYTAYMATLGAGVLLVVLVLAEPGPLRRRLAGLVWPAGAVAVALALLAPLLVPAQRIIAAATPSPGVVFRAAPDEAFLARLLPATAGVSGTPALHVGMLFAVLALGLAANGAVPRRERLVWCGALVLVAVSFQERPTHLAWHAFDTPNGNPYRQAFVLAGLLVVAGFLSASAGVGRRPLLVGAGGAAVLAAVTGRAADTTSATLPLAALGLVVAVALLLAADGRLPRGLPVALPAALPAAVRAALPAAVGVAVVLATAAELGASGVVVDARRAAALGQVRTTDTRLGRARQQVAAADAWPVARTDPGATITANDPMLVGGQGSEYYSSTIQTATTRTLVGLGWGYSAFGRALADPADPVTDAVFAVRNRLVPSSPGSSRRGVARMTTRVAVAPLVTLRAGDPPASGGTVWARRDALLGAPVYEVPDVRVALPAGTSGAPEAAGTVYVSPAPGQVLPLTARCSPGSAVYLASPALVGEAGSGGVFVAGLPARALGPGRYSGMPVRRVGTAGADGAVRVDVRPAGRVLHLARFPLACLPAGALERAVAALVPAGAVTAGSRTLSFDVTASGPVTAVIAVPLVDGWSCRGAVRSSSPRSWGGLLAVAVRPGRVTCAYTPPGTGTGLAAGAAGLLALAVLLAAARRAARGPAAPGPGRLTAAPGTVSGPDAAAPGRPE